MYRGNPGGPVGKLARFERCSESKSHLIKHLSNLSNHEVKVWTQIHLSQCKDGTKGKAEKRSNAIPNSQREINTVHNFFGEFR